MRRAATLPSTSPSPAIPSSSSHSHSHPPIVPLLTTCKKLFAPPHSSPSIFSRDSIHCFSNLSSALSRELFSECPRRFQSCHLCHLQYRFGLRHRIEDRLQRYNIQGQVRAIMHLQRKSRKNSPSSRHCGRLGRTNKGMIRSMSSPALFNRGASIAATALVATATASVSYAAYYYFALVFLSSSSLTVASPTISPAPSSGASEGDVLIRKEGDGYGYEYVGYDTYVGSNNEDGKGSKAAHASDRVAEAISASGLILGNGKAGSTRSDDDALRTTLDPLHIHRYTCPVYGCPLLPLDVHFDEEVKRQLEIMRQQQQHQNKDSPDPSASPSSAPSSSGTTPSDSSQGDIIGADDRTKYILKSSGSEMAATLTLVGYKGGRMKDQINQDRAFVLSPFSYHNIPPTDAGLDSNQHQQTKQKDAGEGIALSRLLGVFDGHAKFGEQVSEYVAKTLPALLGSKLANYDGQIERTTSAAAEENGMEGNNGLHILKQQKRDRDIAQILHETFLELDATAPADPSGGCTASILLQINSKIYVANAGDSRSFVAVHVVPPPTTLPSSSSPFATTTILYSTREDKPHLPNERQRVEKMGGRVYVPPNYHITGTGTTRVMYVDPISGGTNGLAMSRSIGDWDAGSVGVVPDPLVDVLDLTQMKAKVLAELNGKNHCHHDDHDDGSLEEVTIDPATGDVMQHPDSSPSSKQPNCIQYTEDNIKVFAFSATDGLLDFLPPDAIAGHVAKGLYNTITKDDEDNNNNDESSSLHIIHPLTACEDLIYAAAQGWQKEKGGRYRDDIAIAVADLEIPQNR